MRGMIIMAYNTEELYQMASKYIKKNGWQASQRLHDEARDKATKNYVNVVWGDKTNGV